MTRYLPLILCMSVSFSGWAAEPVPDRGPLRLSLKRAVEMALSPEGNTYIQLSDENVRISKARSAEARSAFLPDIEGQAGQATDMRSLSAMGLDLAASTTLLGAANHPPPCTASALVCEILATSEKPLLDDIANQIPKVIGPFTSVDIRVRATQSIFDLSNIRRYQSSRAALRATKNDRSQTDQAVSAVVAKAYLAALRANADVEAAEATESLAEAVLKQSQNQKNAGTGTGIDVTRAKVQLSDAKQKLLVTRNQRTKSYLQLLRAMNLSLSTELELTDKLAYAPVEALTLDQARADAMKTRFDLQAQQERESAARLNANSVKFERLPNMVAFADYGTTGVNNTIVSLLPTRDYGFALRVPIFDGGRRDARRAETAAQFHQERIKTNDLRDQIELDLRTALDSLQSADQQVQVAQEGLTLADSEFTQARRRFAAGVASSLEVTDSQTRLERARDNQINALFNHNVARIDLGQAMGSVQRMIQ